MRQLHPRITALALLFTPFGFAEALPAQVVEWILYKGPVHLQDTSNTQPTAPSFWEAGVLVDTSSPGDAGLITISGGGIVGSMPLEHDGNGFWELAQDFDTQAAMNAMIPSNATYTLTISGGTLGILTQSAQIGPEQYPNTPYLTGSSLDTAYQFPAAAATTLTWNNPGALTQNAGHTVFDIADRDWNEVYSLFVPGAVTQDTVPANTLSADDCFNGYLAFTETTSVPAGGFGVGGLAIHVTATDFEIRTWPYPTVSCAWHETYGAGCAGLELFSNDPILGTNWDLTTTGIEPLSLAFTYFSFGPQEPGLPLSAFGLNAPGCESYIDVFAIVANLGGLGVNGQLTVSISVPAAQSFGGVLFYAQTIALTSQTPAGIGTSNVVEAAFGS